MYFRFIFGGIPSLAERKNAFPTLRIEPYRRECIYAFRYQRSALSTKRKHIFSGFPDRMCFPFFQMAGVFSQLELSMIRERVRSGMANAKAKGKQIGRPQITRDSIPAIFLRHYPAFKNGQLNISELARVCDLSRTTGYKYLSLLDA